MLIVSAFASESMCTVMWTCFKHSEEEAAARMWLRGGSSQRIRDGLYVGFHINDLDPSALRRTDCPRPRGLTLVGDNLDCVSVTRVCSMGRRQGIELSLCCLHGPLCW